MESVTYKSNIPFEVPPRGEPDRSRPTPTVGICRDMSGNVGKCRGRSWEGTFLIICFTEPVPEGVGCFPQSSATPLIYQCTFSWFFYALDGEWRSQKV